MNTTMVMASNVLQTGSNLQSKYNRTGNNYNTRSYDRDDEEEMKDFKHLPKAKIVEATQALFTKKVKQLTFPKNPTLFGTENPTKKSQTAHGTRNNSMMRP